MSSTMNHQCKLVQDHSKFSFYFWNTLSWKPVDNTILKWEAKVDKGEFSNRNHNKTVIIANLIFYWNKKKWPLVKQCLKLEADFLKTMKEKQTKNETAAFNLMFWLLKKWNSLS